MRYYAIKPITSDTFPEFLKARRKYVRNLREPRYISDAQCEVYGWALYDAFIPHDKRQKRDWRLPADDPEWLLESNVRPVNQVTYRQVEEQKLRKRIRRKYKDCTEQFIDEIVWAAYEPSASPVAVEDKDVRVYVESSNWFLNWRPYRADVTLTTYDTSKNREWRNES